MYAVIEETLKEGRKKLAESDPSIIQIIQTMPHEIVETIGMIYINETLEKLKLSIN